MHPITPSTSSVYETEDSVNQYLLFHYGNAEQLPYAFGPHASLHFPVRCVLESLKGLDLVSHAHALDIGCATGRASFELARYFDRVTGIDVSKQFIEIAKQLQQHKRINYHSLEEGEKYSSHTATVPLGIRTDRIHFRCMDAIHLFKSSQSFDFVLAANVICRLPDPRTFLESLHLLVNPKGVFALASPYSWLEGFTPRHKWLGSDTRSSFEEIQEIMTPHFHLLHTMDLPFLIREHARKYQWGISQLSLWKK